MVDHNPGSRSIDQEKASLLRMNSAMGYRRICKTSLTGRRGVGDGGDSVCGMVPTRINACGSAVRPVRRRTISRLAWSSIMWVNVQVASEAIVHSSNTVESASPHPKAFSRLSS